MSHPASIRNHLSMKPFPNNISLRNGIFIYLFVVSCRPEIGHAEVDFINTPIT